MTTFWGEVLVIFLMLLANGVFALSELALVSARKARLQADAERGDARAARALAVAEDPERFLSTVQIGITLVGTLAGAFGGARLADDVAYWVTFVVPSIEPYSHQLAFGLVVVLITFSSLVVGELVPKQLALANPERAAKILAGPMGFLSKAAAPLVWVLSGTSAILVRALGVKPGTEPAVTEEELKILIEKGEEQGIFNATEREIVERVFRLSDRPVSALMTPRNDLIWLEVHEPRETIVRKIAESRYSYYPVCDTKLDHVVGLASVKALFPVIARGGPIDLRAAMGEALRVQENAPAIQVLEKFRESGRHFALVVDEYEGLAGVITLTDFLEAMLGDAVSADDSGELRAVQRDDGSWLISGWVPIDDLKDFLEIDSLPGDIDYRSYQTVGGFMFAMLGRVPVVAEHFTYAGWRFEVVDMDGPRVDKILVQRVDASHAIAGQPPVD